MSLDEDDQAGADQAREDWSFPWEQPVHELFPALHEAQSAWMSQIDSLRAPDRKTHELIRLACTVIVRNGDGVARHASLAREVGASWDEVIGSIMLTAPSFGLLPAAEAVPHARRGFAAAVAPDDEDEDDDGDD
jgi:alkylhydroperoxidase/carboxymuconolactone decarboxylase family protein YurZ